MLKVYLWENSDLDFRPSRSLVANVTGKVEGVIPGDLDYDGFLDMLVTFKRQGRKYMQVFLQSSDSFSEQSPIEIPLDSQPVALDIDGDLKLEILNNQNSTVSVYKFDKTLTVNSELSAYSSTEESCLSFNQFSFAYPHSIGFVDLNKDCLSDLFMTVEYEGKTFFEVWLNAKDGTYCKVLQEPAPSGTRQVSFADLDRNGVEDIIYAVCEGEGCSEKNEIHIVYNFNEVSNDCSFSFGDLKKFELKELSLTENGKFKTIVKLEDKFFENSDFPVMVRFGDLDLDGYPDALVTLTNSSESYVQFLRNSECSHCSVGERTLKIDSDGDLSKLQTVKGAVFGCFFDLDDKGVLDIIVVSQNETTFRVNSFYNNFQSDTFHLKALALNGHSKGGYSSAYPGAVFMFTLTELDMNKVVMHSTQMPLTSFYALYTPYCVYGLGRTNSYIEEFYVALPLKKNNYRAWTPIIPNSYLIASPDKDKTEDWYLELFASPTDQIGIIIGVCCGCMLLIGLIVIYNYFKEKKEDRRLFGIKF